MLLDEIRILARNKKEEVYKNSESTEKQKDFADMTVKFFSNQDYITGSNEFVVSRLLYYLGYDVTQLNNIYEQLMHDLTKQYNVVSPEQLAEIMKERENNNHGSK